MTDQPDTVDPMILALITELHTLEDLLHHRCLNLDGLRYGFRFCTRTDNLAAHANAAQIRERVLAGFIAALAHETGLPESYWTDRTIVDVPDDVSGLDDE